MMDHRAWMYGIRRHSHTFILEVSKFVEAGKKHAYICKTNEVLLMDTQFGPTIVVEECDVDMEHMLRHNEPEVLLGSAKGLENFETLKKAAKDHMYVGCGKDWAVLHFLLHLLILKAKFGWSDNSFNDLLTLLDNLLPKPNFVPKNTYEAKKIINPFKMHVQRIHASWNHCILYHGEYATLEKCPNCDASCYKNNTDFCEDCAGSSIGNKRKKVAKKSVGAQVEIAKKSASAQVLKCRVSTNNMNPFGERSSMQVC
uniref:Uncharacterized protein n=1 Tax=Setaria italica TaxID=4555 RepID=K3YEA6_SETIT